MKKQLLLFVILLGAFVTAEAQKTDTARLLVHYKFTHVRDTTDRAHPFTENMVLYVGKSAAAYRSYDRISANAQFKKAYAEAAAASPDGQVRINRRGVGTPVEYYQYPNDQKLFTKDQLMFNNYLIEAPIPAIDWKISSDTSTFGGLHCQKATGYFKGRDYTVWFCPDLPVHTGPWKLNGLPGVIVDARDAKNEVVFKFDGLEHAIPSPPKSQPQADQPPILRDLDDDMNLIGTPPRTIKTTQKEFDKLKETMEKDPNAFAQAIVAGNRADGVKMDNIRVAKGPAPRGPVINNPIELPAKK
ncbi:GLPGLI family protein [Mucilaginibacter dorajii]|uniref:GLPGLI family protein n=1 Tax=Mucilaginibacter dorajii TaxID=692994 RepID=A0ABP7Q1W0_9SPHI|nr:GLPGLI family protein [Mucilaginibacter dorajii]MCS3732848.1 GLPGLI family protein [Mucilaginibacter dorajii]